MYKNIEKLKTLIQIHTQIQNKTKKFWYNGWVNVRVM